MSLSGMSDVVYKIKSTGPSVEPCGTQYDSVFNFYGLMPIFQIGRKPKLEHDQIFHTTVYLLIVLKHRSYIIIVIIIITFY